MKKLDIEIRNKAKKNKRKYNGKIFEQNSKNENNEKRQKKLAMVLVGNVEVASFDHKLFFMRKKDL